MTPPSTAFLFRLIFAMLIVTTFGNLVAAADLPQVEMITDNYGYMLSLFPDDFSNWNRAVKDYSTITPDASALKDFWDRQKDSILSLMSQYAGISWVEQSFDIYIVKYYPDYACDNPMTIPLTGKRTGDRILALPQGISPYITLFQQLAKRLLSQVNYKGATTYYIAGHPLLERTPRRLDNLANLLALRTMSDFFEIDSVMDVFRSAPWKERELGQPVFFGYFWNKWRLSPDTTLAYMIASEPYGSKLVMLTRPPAQSRPGREIWNSYQGQVPGGGKIGLSVVRDASGLYRIADIDTLRLGYLSGLRKGDLIRSVEGSVPANLKQLFSLILEHLSDGAHVNIVRKNQPDAVILYSQP